MELQTQKTEKKVPHIDAFAARLVEILMEESQGGQRSVELGIVERQRKEINSRWNGLVYGLRKQSILFGRRQHHLVLSPRYLRLLKPGQPVEEVLRDCENQHCDVCQQLQLNV